MWYEASFFEKLGRQPELLDTLLSSDLDWYWHYDGPKNPLELLTSETASDLRKDLQDFLQPTNSSFELIGVGAHANEDPLSPQSYRHALSKFSSENGEPIEIVIVQEGDMLFDCIFVPREPSKSVQKLLRAWGISENAVREKHEDEGTFEALFQTVIARAHYNCCGTGTLRLSYENRAFSFIRVSRRLMTPAVKKETPINPCELCAHCAFAVRRYATSQ